MRSASSPIIQTEPALDSIAAVGGEKVPLRSGKGEVRSSLEWRVVRTV